MKHYELYDFGRLNMSSILIVPIKKIIVFVYGGFYYGKEFNEFNGKSKDN